VDLSERPAEGARIFEGGLMKRLGWIAAALLLLELCLMGAPIAVQLPTSDLTTALTSFNSVSFNGQVRWESASTGHYKLRLSNGTLGSPGLVTGGDGITWNSDAPQSFSFGFNGTLATLSVTDGGTPYTISATPSSTQVNSLLIRIRTNGTSSVELSDLRVDGVSLNISSISLQNVTSEAFLFVSNVFSPFTLTGLLRMTRNGGASGAEVPAMQIYAGVSPNADTANVPEPSTWLLAGIGVSLLMLGRIRRWRCSLQARD
jgi:hypothetical protein